MVNRLCLLLSVVTNWDIKIGVEIDYPLFQSWSVFSVDGYEIDGMLKLVSSYMCPCSLGCIPAKKINKRSSAAFALVRG